jgi:hypothetical protein
MKITSKRGLRPVEVVELDGELESFGIIVSDSFALTPEEAKRIDEIFKDIRRQLEEIGKK